MKIIATKIAKILGAALMFALIPVGYARDSLALPANGTIAFVSNRDGDSDIYLMNPDGSEQTALTSNSVHDDFPTWSPDGRTIAFVTQNGTAYSINLMNANGTDARQVTTFSLNPNAAGFGICWSPDGGKIAFQDSTDIFTINADGSNRVNLTNGQFVNYEPSWSPDGLHIAFSRSGPFTGNYGEVYLMNANGSDVRRITNSPTYTINGSPDWSPDGGKIALTAANDDMDNSHLALVDPAGTNLKFILFCYNLGNGELINQPKWSPDGAKIVFHSSGYTNSNMQIWTINPDGTGLTQLTTSNPNNFHPDWQPLRQTATLSGRVVTPDGRGLRNTTVTLTDPQGNRRNVTTSSFGAYAFDNVETGSTYAIAVSSRRYRFAARSLDINTNVVDVDFIGVE